MCVFLCVNAYTCMCPHGARGGQKGPSDPELQLAVESPSGCWELDSGPLQDQQASLTLSHLCRPNAGLFSPAPQSPEALCIIFLLLFRLDNLYLSPSSLTHSSVVCCSLLSLCGENLNFSIFFSSSVLKLPFGSLLTACAALSRVSTFPFVLGTFAFISWNLKCFFFFDNFNASVICSITCC